MSEVPRGIDRKEGFGWLSLCCFEPPFVKVYLVRDTMKWLSGLYFERRQRMNVKAGRLNGCHNLKMFAILSHERGVFYQAAQDVWAECDSSRALCILSPVVFSYLSDKAQLETGLKHNLT